ncbi:hypothetical protein ACIA5D_32800 [Actinoplanes sp. NPDC051513]|uniref:hypothetical protein n=1 Tax=Actinoplanes sp. NPDC051513 TaxID=3363908 RepID=UPI0037B48B35
MTNRDTAATTLETYPADLGGVDKKALAERGPHPGRPYRVRGGVQDLRRRV